MADATAFELSYGLGCVPPGNVVFEPNPVEWLVFGQ
jgi:hypothetical protein